MKVNEATMPYQITKGYKKTEVGLIPVDWDTKKIGNALKIKHGKSQKQVEDSNGDYPILGTGGFMGLSNTYLYNKPSVLIGRKGTIDAPKYIDKPFWTVDTLFYSEVNKNYSAKYLYYIFCTINWYAYNEASGVPSLNARTIEEIKIPLPPTLAEQRAIATALSDTDALIQSLEQLIAKKKTIKQGTMQQLLTGKMRLKGFEKKKGYQKTEVGEIPLDWEMTNIDKLINTDVIYKPLDGNHGDIHPKKSDFVNSGIPFIMANNVYDGKVDLKKCNFIKRTQAEKLQKGFSLLGDVLLTHKGTVGNTALVKRIKYPYIMLTPQVTYYRVKDTKRLYNKYIYHFFNSEKFKSVLKSLSGGATREYIGIVKQRELPFVLPSNLEEQKAIAKILSDMDAEIEGLEQQRDKYKAIKQGMMQELLTGKTRLI